MRPGRIAAVVIGSLGILIGLALGAAGGAAVWAHSTQRDSAGFYTSPDNYLSTTGYAITAAVDFGHQPAGRDWVVTSLVDQVRIHASSSAGTPLFIGIAPTAEVNSFLAGVAHEEVTDLSFGPWTTLTRAVPGSQPAGLPGNWGSWVRWTSGTASQTLTWTPRSGQWSAVVMNADASPGVTVAATVAAKTGVLLPVGLGLGGFGLLLLIGASLLLAFGLRRPEEIPTASAGHPDAVPPEAGLPWATPASAAGASYPVRLDGHLDPSVSRWLWLVKWVLVVPHVLVLALLWIAVTLLTVIAGVSILFTGRYPRAIFDFNVGVMRWTWRVSFYAESGFATDRYPPFSLASDPNYPADFSVEYPERLSRGLVLVKWWLLALPHYLVVAIFVGGWGVGWNGAWRLAGGGGLVALLALIAAVILAATGRYPERIFDFVMGMNRWCYRVLAYAALMRDEYPPFRLDTGGTDPGSLPTLPPSPSPTPHGEPVPVGNQ